MALLVLAQVLAAKKKTAATRKRRRRVIKNARKIVSFHLEDGFGNVSDNLPLCLPRSGAVDGVHGPFEEDEGHRLVLVWVEKAVHVGSDLVE